MITVMIAGFLNSDYWFVWFDDFVKVSLALPGMIAEICGVLKERQRFYSIEKIVT